MEKFVSVVKDYTEFAMSTKSQDMILFSAWLKNKYSQNPNEGVTSNEEKMEVQIFNSIGNIADCIDRSIKISIQKTNIKSTLDVKILLAIFHSNGKLSKKNLSEKLHAERTTIIESIRRLTRKGLVIEGGKPKKGESKLKLTKDGKDQVNIIEPRINQIIKLVTSNLDKEQKKILIPILNEICILQESLNKLGKTDILTMLTSK